MSRPNWNARMRTNDICAAQAISCTLYRWPTCVRDPADSDNNSADMLLQVAHNNEGTRCIRRSQLLCRNQMLRGKTACHAAIWHGEIRLDRIHFQRLAILSFSPSITQISRCWRRAEAWTLTHIQNNLDLDADCSQMYATDECHLTL